MVCCEPHGVQWSLHMVMDGGPSITSHSQLQTTGYSELVKQRLAWTAWLICQPRREAKGVRGCQLQWLVWNLERCEVRELGNVSPGAGPAMSQVRGQI